MLSIRRIYKVWIYSTSNKFCFCGIVKYAYWLLSSNQIVFGFHSAINNASFNKLFYAAYCFSN